MYTWRAGTLKRDNLGCTSSHPQNTMWAKLQASSSFLFTIALAAFCRFYALNRVPPGIYWDEVIDAQKGLETVRTGSFEVFYHVGSGREGLWINMVGLAEALFGANQFGLRVCAALAGTLTVVFVYLLARELFSSRVAIFSAWFLALSFWHIWLSRMAFRAVLMPLFLSASLYFLLRAWREERAAPSPVSRWLLVVLSGVLYGLGFHTYIAFRFTPFLIAVFFLSEYRRRKTSGQMTSRWLAMGAVWLGAALLVALPLGLYFLHHPQDFWLRARQVSIFSAPNPTKAFGIALLATAGMFNIRGDPGALFNIPDAPHLLLPVGIVFLLGLVLAGKRAFQKDCRASGYGLLCIWFAILLVPQLLTLDAPNSVRVVGVVPPVFMFAGLGADAIYERLKHRKAYVYAFFLAFILVGAVEIYRYFIVWGRNPEVARAFAQRYVEVGQYLNTLPRGTASYVIAGDWGRESVRFLTQESHPVKFLNAEQVGATDFPCDSVIVPLYNTPMVFTDLADRKIQIQSIDKRDFVAAVVQCTH
jgi:4-amino-4-deoxy-L-arabinose transferase-like glycosyltransferase